MSSTEGNVVTNNPNATAAVITGAIASIVVWVAGLAGVEMEPAIGSAFAVVLIAGVLGIGGFIKSLVGKNNS